MPSLGDLIHQQALVAKQGQKFDLALVADILPKALKELDPSLYGAWEQGLIRVLKIVGGKRRVLQLAVDSSTALLLDYSLPTLLQTLNQSLGELAIEKIQLKHQNPNTLTVQTSIPKVLTKD